METEEQRFNKLRQESWNNALHTFGKAYVYNKRAGRYGFLVNLLKVFGIVVPVAVGATALGYGFQSAVLQNAIALAIPLSIIQLLISVFAVTFKWDDELAYSYESSNDYNNLSEEFKVLGNLPPNNFQKLQDEVKIANTKLRLRGEQDSKHNIKEWELRMGMRYALREFKRECYGCKKIPISMESTDCDVCGRFNISLFKKLLNYE